MKKKLPLLLPILLMLTSCGGDSYTGTYSFQMGKDSSTHIGIFMELTDQADETTPGAKKFSLNFDITGNANSDTSADTEEDTSSSVSSSTEATSSSSEDSSSDTLDYSTQDILDLLEDHTLNGYYSIVDTTVGKKEGKQVTLGTNLLSEALDDKAFELPPAMTEKFIYATIDGDTITLTFPVSMTDLLFQLYWYGYSVDLANFTYEELPEAHDLGSHPTAEEAAKIRETEAAKDTISLYKNFRDFHVLKMGLKKAS